MDRLSSMAAFVKAPEVGSFAATADALGMSPQVVAKHVAYLESRMGTRLLNLLADRFGRAPEKVASIVVAGHLAGVVFLPLALWVTLG